MSRVFPNLGRGAERLKKLPVDFITDDGVGPEAVRVSMVSKPDPTGVLEDVDFKPHKRTPPPAPVKKSKGGKKQSKVSRRLTKRKHTRKHRRTYRKKRKGSKTRRKH